MTMWGADVGELERLAAQFGQYGDTLDASRGQLNSRVHTAPWRGEEAVRFRQDWDQVYLPRLAAAVWYLREGRAALLRNAEEQRRASGLDGSSGTSAHHGFRLASLFDSSLVARAALLGTALAGIVARAGDAAFGGDLLKLRFLEGNPEIARLPGRLGSELLADAKSVHVGALGALGLAIDAAGFVDDFGSDDWADALFDSGHLLLDTAAVAVPTVGLMLGAFRVGEEAGNWLDRRFHITDPVADFAYDSIQKAKNFVRGFLFADDDKPQPTPAPSTPPIAAPGSTSGERSAAAFVNQYTGKSVDVDKAFGNQCWDLAAKYATQVVGVPASVGLPTGDGTAAGVYGNFPQPLSQYFDRIPYSAGVAPQPGDLVVWSHDLPHSGNAGHIAIVVSSAPGGAEFTSFDQNWPVGHAPHTVEHDYNHVAGFLRPKHFQD